MKKLLAIFMLSLLFLSGCGKKQQQGTAHEKTSPRYVHTAIGSSIRSLDPRVGNEYPAAFIIRSIYEGLMRMGENGTLHPGMASSYEISEDRTRYTFHLREAYWSNGDPVTAYDFEYAWKKAVSPQFAKTGAFTFYTIKNVEACLNEEVDSEAVGVKAIDDHTLVVDLEHPAPYFLSLTTCPTFMPINKRIDLAHKDWANKGDEFFTCNGPFCISDWKKGDSITLGRNPKYWQVEDVKLDGIHAMIVEDTMTQYFMFIKGALDWFGEPISGGIPPEITQDKRKQDQIYSFESFGLYWLFVNTESFPLNNKNFRKALAYAINRQDIAEHVFQLGEKPAMGIMADNFRLNEEPYFQDADYDKARAYFKLALDELGLEKESIPTIKISHSVRVLSSRSSQALQQQWKDVLGINVELDQKEWPVHFTNVSKGNFQIGEMAWVSWLYDPIYLLDTFRTKSFATNMSRWEHDTYKHYLELSDNEIDVDKRRDHLRNAEAFLMEELPVIPICFIRTIFMQTPKLKGVCITPLKELDFRWAYFEEN